MDDCIDSLCSAKVISALDAKCGHETAETEQVGMY